MNSDRGAALVERILARSSDLSPSERDRARRILLDVMHHGDADRVLALGDSVITRVDGRRPAGVSPWRRRWRDLEFQVRPAEPVEAVPGHAAVSRLTAWAARLLPPADQPDYEELFRSELYDLAQSGSGRWAQLAYAIRVLIRAPQLRRELRAPARERSW